MPTTTGKIYLGSTLVSGGAGEDSEPIPYSRPNDWLPMPEFTDQGFVALVAVYEHGSNFIGIQCSGAFEVFWGDGTSETFNSNTQLSRNLLWSNYDENTLTSRGYRQAIIRLVPQSGSNITALDLGFKNTQSNLQNGYTTGILDLYVNGPNLTTLAINGTNQKHRLLERVNLNNTGSVSNFTELLRDCSLLQDVTIGTIVTITDTSNMFNGCSSLETVPLFNTSSVTTMANMFNGCSNLKKLPLFNTSSVTTMSFMFNGCSSLETVPLFNTSSVTTMASMFSSCSRLTTVPLFNTSSVTTMASMFSSCSRLETVPLFDTSSVTTMNNMFSNCINLFSVPTFNTTAITNASSMFSSCRILNEVPALNLSAVTGTNLTSIVGSCPSLSAFKATGMNISFSVTNCRLSASALNEIYTNLSATGTGKTITVTGNWGTATDTPSIATAKGWTVSG